MSNPPHPNDPVSLAGDLGETIAVILVNYNSGPQLARALDSLVVQTRAPDEILVVDNGSTDGSLGLVDWQRHPDLKLLCLSGNFGFAAATNAAARAARSRWLAMLNCDAEAEPGWLEALLRAAGRHPGCGVFASAQALLDRPSVLDGAGDVYSATGLAWRGSHGRPLAEMPGEGRCFGACAAGAFMSRRLFLDLGGFEESFFCYLEDVDFACRARLAGQECVFVPSARILHRSGGCSGAKSDWTLRISSRNRLRLYLRNTPLLLLLATWPLFLFGVWLSLLQAMRHRRGRAVLGGLADGLRQLPGTLRQRRQPVAATPRGPGPDLHCSRPVARPSGTVPMIRAGLRRGGLLRGLRPMPPAAVSGHGRTGPAVDGGSGAAAVREPAQVLATQECIRCVRRRIHGRAAGAGFPESRPKPG
ncbi:glycosyltransferase family 2 protein [Mangrovicoccus ximenensis]|uniref:glycosyltransferase family 2 protein n=1 Tax=Mangrovicoccus ximenensis TaxID=1911570 RepID=UPI000D35DFB8|nr:glycosyltransferase family 2 protein [Mangrovicoccus ximenensis]